MSDVDGLGSSAYPEHRSAVVQSPANGFDGALVAAPVDPRQVRNVVVVSVERGIISPPPSSRTPSMAASSGSGASLVGSMTRKRAPSSVRVLRTEW